jgi:two-component system, OmpR family, heavy metal sensor histidine kinase CusS
MSEPIDNDRDPSAPAQTPPSRSWSLATRLTVWYALSSFALFLVGSLVLYFALVRNLDEEDDLYLTDQIHVIRLLLRERPDDVEALNQEVDLEVGARRHAKIYIRVLDEKRRSIAETPVMNAIFSADSFPAPPESDPRDGTDVMFDGHPYRLMAGLAAGPGSERPRFEIQVALDRSHEQIVLARYRLQLVVVSTVVLLICAWIGHRIARRGVRPIAQITAIGRRIHSMTLGERIGLGSLPAELSDLASTFNAMLDRLEESFGRLARFSADLAHELRTPINNLRGEAEVALHKSRTAEEYQGVLASVLDECARLSRMIDGLLFLARAEQPQAQIMRERVELAREMEKVCEFYEPAAREAGVRLSVDAPRDSCADLDRTLLQRAIGNLLDNALRYTGPGGEISIIVRQGDRDTTIEVADTGTGIMSKHLPHVFDRLYRADVSRASASGGLGLGLAIVRSVAELHGGTVGIDSEPGKGTRITMTFTRSVARDAVMS